MQASRRGRIGSVSVFEERDGRLTLRAGGDLRGFTVELDAIGDLVAVRGDFAGLTGHDPRGCLRSNLADFPIADGGLVLSEILFAAGTDRRLDEILLRLRHADGSILALRALGRPAAGGRDTMQLLCVFDPALQATAHEDGADALRARLEDLRASADGSMLELVFLELGTPDGLEALGLEAASAQAFGADVARTLRQASVDGRSAHEVAPGRYGLVAERGRDLAALGARLAERIAREPALAETIRPALKALALDAETLASADLGAILDHALERFAADGLDSVIYADLAGVGAGLTAERESRDALLRRLLDGKAFRFRLRRAVDLTDLSIDHMIAEPALEAEGDGMEWAEIQALAARDAGLRRRVDWAQARALAREAPLPRPIALDIALGSIAEPALLRDLAACLKAPAVNGLILRLAGFAPGEARIDSALKGLRKAGFRIALLGAEVGTVSPEALDALPADIVRADPAITRSAPALALQRGMLRTVIRRCRAAGITLLFEGIGEPDIARLLSELPGAAAAGPVFDAPADRPDRAGSAETMLDHTP